jgi:hypothetical protein
MREQFLSTKVNKLEAVTVTSLLHELYVGHCSLCVVVLLVYLTGNLQDLTLDDPTFIYC